MSSANVASDMIDESHARIPPAESGAELKLPPASGTNPEVRIPLRLLEVLGKQEHKLTFSLVNHWRQPNFRKGRPPAHPDEHGKLCYGNSAREIRAKTAG